MKIFDSVLRITVLSTVILFSGFTTFGQTTYYVNTSGNNTNSGTSWGTAFATLSFALTQASSGDEIWVAEGTYYPVDCNPCSPSDREFSFNLISGVAVYGGFDGTESSLSERDPEMNETILSGDINGTGNHDGNSFSVVNGSGVGNTAVLDGFTIMLGNADGSSPDPSDPSRSGGGIYISDGSPTLSNLIVTENWASDTDNRGGGIHVYGFSSDPVINNSVFSNNDAFQGGAINLHTFSSLTVTNCTIIENTGGGIYLWSNTEISISLSLIEGNSGGPALTTRFNSIAHINNSSFIGNTAEQAGGGVFNWDSELYVKNSVFSGNTADTWGGAIYNTGGSVFEATNSLFYGNTAGTEGGAIFRINTTPVKLINCVISGNSAGIQGGGISNPDQFGSIEIVNSILWNNQANNQTNTLSASIFNLNSSNVDISYSLIGNSGGSSNWNGSAGNDLGNNIDLDPQFLEDVDLNNLPTSTANLRVTVCSPVIDAGNPDTTGLDLPDLDLDENPRVFNALGTPSAIIDMGAYEFPDPIVSGGIIYVNASVPVSGNGTSWDCAFADLQDALAVADDGDEIWVAAGTYYPVDCNPCSPSDREFSFNLISGVAVYGGFDGTEISLSERNPELNVTILSGDINGTGNHDGNSYTVVNGSGVDNTAVFDGFTIRLGNADVDSGDTSAPDRSGAGIYISNGSPSLNNLIVEENITLPGGNRGGGIYVDGASAHPIIENSTIRNNQGSEGGGINVRGDGNLTISNSDILENAGGGIFVQQNVNIFIFGCLLEGNTGRSPLSIFQNSFAQIENTSIINNSGGFAGGGILNYSSEIQLLNCVISGNTASSIGGAVYNEDVNSWGTPNFEARNSLFNGNTAGSSNGGAFFNANDTEVKLINCVLSGNSSGGQGGAVYNQDDANVEIINTIIWNNQANGQTNTTHASITNDGNSESNISFSLIANSGGSSNWNTDIGNNLGNNIDRNPVFEQDGDPLTAPNTIGDFRLTTCSPVIDAGNPDTTGLDLPDLDLDENPRVFNALGTPSAIIDMGAYEFSDPIVSDGIIYVNASVPVPGNGTSWDCAFADLQDALAAANDGDEIWVAAGTYYPTSDPSDRNAKFFLKRDVALYGGFNGTEENREERDWINNETILSGDINQTGLDDGNSYNVVDASCGSVEDPDCPNENTVLDGFTITMGYGDGAGNDSAGAGLLSIYGRPTVRNCTFWGNYADLGGGAIYNFGGEILIQNCLFHDNYDDFGKGSALFFSGSSAEIVNSTFYANTSNANAGAMYAEFGSIVEIVNSIFWENGNTDFSFSGPDDPDVFYSIVQQQSGTYPGTGNLNVNPFFVDADVRDFKLSDCSPAIDAGNPDTTGLNLPELDLAGNPRIFNATGGPDRIDMGAFEFQSTVSFSDAIFVNANNPNPGTGISWDCALNDLQEALTLADSGSVIWVAAGTYYPTSGTNRSISFEMKNGVSIYGGFEGTETQLSERDWEANVTILSGDIGDPGDPSDNSFQVVTAGGGVSNARIDGFTITLGNADGGGANNQGAGMRVFGGASVHIENCSFLDNTAADRGAGVKVLSSTATIKNSLFQSNTAEIGAGLLANTGANVTVENSIFRNNGANVRGGGVFYNTSTGQLKNCLFYNNTALTEGGAVMMDVLANLEIINSTITNNFAPDGGGLRIAGSNAIITNSIFWENSEEINGSPGNIDASFSIIQGGFAGTGNFSANPLFNDPEGNDFTLQACSPAIDAGDNDALGVSDTLDLDGNPRFFDATGQGTPIVDIGAYEYQDVAPAAGNENVIYVNAGNASSGNGRSWGCALDNLQDALEIAQEGDTIWVAAGTYLPSAWPAGCTGCATDRDFTFLLRDGVSVYGGFAGTENLLIERDIEANETILSGDIGTQGDESDNVHHVVLVSFANAVPTAHLDGFTITGGNADGSGSTTVNGNSIFRNIGAGIYLEWGTNTLINNTVSGNMATNGGGITIRFGINSLIDNTVVDNVAIIDGGGVQSFSAVSYFSNNSILGNSSERGGGIFLFSGESTLSGNTVSENSAETQGGGIFTQEGTNKLLFNTVSANTAQFGSGVYSREGINTMTNNLLLGNQAAFSGGGIYTRDGVHTITNNTLVGNSVTTNGGGIFSQNSTDTLTNNIIWGNSNGIFNSGSDLTVTYSIVQGGFPGTGNLDLDPLFVDQPSVGLGTAGDLRLLECSPAIDAGDNNALGVNDTLDLDGNPRFFDATGQETAIVDMGAYEYQDIVPGAGSENVIYVNASNPEPGNGRSWECAYDDLQLALAAAQEGDTIWVAEGIYRPTQNTDQSVSFELKSGVVILGGFNGTESLASERDWEMNPVILDGDINSSGNIQGNSFQIVQAINVDSTAVLDGVTIQGGNANDFNQANGGGIYIESASPLIRNVVIQSNRSAFGGGGVSVVANSSPLFYQCIFANNTVGEGVLGGGALIVESSPVFINCTFFENDAFFGGGLANFNAITTIENSVFTNNSSLDGAGVFNDDMSQLFLFECEFIDNMASGSGGAIYHAGNSSATIINCFFEENSADGDGGAIFSLQSSEIEIQGSSFLENNAQFGGAISSQGASVITVIASLFQENSSSNVGGAILAQNGNTFLSIDSSTFNDNQAIGSGGAIAILNSGEIELANSIFEGNTADVDGGAVIIWNQALGNIVNSNFESNSAEGTGGAVYVGQGSSGEIDGCIFWENSALNGGAITASTDTEVEIRYSDFRANQADNGSAIFNSSATSSRIVNCVFSGHLSQNEFGGAIYNSFTDAIIINCTFSGNRNVGAVRSGDEGAAISNFNSDPVITNCILWGNSSGIRNENSNPLVSHSIFQDNASGSNVLSVDPRFNDMPDFDDAPSTAGDLRLSGCSPGIDVGDNDALGVNDTLDLDGNPRFFDATDIGQAITDLGAYEVQFQVGTGGNPNTIYVNINNAESGNGLSWDCAFTDLQDALAIAQEGDTIWVAQGIYLPSSGSDQEIAFEMKSGVVVLGGFEGTETMASERDWEANPTILDGDINNSGGSLGNAYQIVRAVEVDSISLLDGFTVQGGFAFGAGTFGNGGGIYIEGSQIRISNVNITNNFGSAGGGGIWIGENSSPIISNVSFTNNSVSEGFFGGGAAVSNSIANFENCYFEDNSAFFGGGIAGLNALVTIDQSVFYQHSVIQGGALFITADSRFSILNSEFTENLANSGGAIYSSDGSFVEIDSSEFISNEVANWGGAIYHTKDSMFISNSYFFLNSAGDGGAVFSDNAFLSVFMTHFDENSATEKGGGIHSDSSQVNIHDSKIERNQAAAEGGGLYQRKGEVEISDSEIEDNEAQKGGGGFSRNGKMNLKNSRIAGNQVSEDGGGVYSDDGELKVEESEIENNIAGRDGGGIKSKETKLEIEDTEIKGNMAMEEGGGIRNKKPRPASRIENSLIKENIAMEKGGGMATDSCEMLVKETEFTENESKKGGNIFKKESNTEYEDVEITKGKAAQGGGVFMEKGAPKFSNVQIKENQALKENNLIGGIPSRSGNDFLDGKGGGIFGLDSRPQLINLTISNNFAEDQGGGFFKEEGEMEFMDSDIEDNQSKEGAGGFGRKGRVVFENSRIKNNSADEDGGGILSDDGELKIKESEIENNTAGRDGGGIKSRESKIEIEETEIKGNVAMREGGGISNRKPRPDSRIEKSMIKENMAMEKGGGMATDSCEMLVKETMFTENESIKGGNIFKKESNTEYEDVEITKGKAAQGGGVFMEKGAPKFSNVQIKENQALKENNLIGGIPSRSGNDFLDGKGGGIFGLDSRPQLINLTISNNFAEDQGGGFFKEEGEMEFMDSDIEDNQSKEGAGGFGRKGRVVFENSRINNNNADEDGGGILSDDGELKIKESEIENNTAGRDGGGIKSRESKIEIEETEIKGNMAMGEGGGIRNSRPRPESRIEKSMIKENMAMEKGGGMATDSCEMLVKETMFTENESKKGGNIFKKESNSEYEDVEISKGKAAQGGGIYMEKGAPKFSDVVVKENQALRENNLIGGAQSRSATDFLDGQGGGIFGLDSRPQLINLNIRNNFAEDQGGGFFQEEGEMEFMESEIEDNQSKEGAGGFGRKGRIVFENSRINNNNADEDGGGILSDDGELKIKESEIENNTAGRDGGGIKSRESKIEIEETEIKGNMAMREGGGIRNSRPRPESRIEKSMIKENMAMEKGGGMATDSCEMMVKETMFTENESMKGGNIFKKESNSEYEDVEITKGKAAQGGGIYMEKGAPKFSDVVVKENQALRENNLIGGAQSRSATDFLDGQGGGIFGLDSRPQLINLTISNNFAEDQGGGFFTEEGEMELEDCIVENNESMEGGGGFSNSTEVNFRNSRLSNNNANSDGGGFYSSNGDVKFTDSEISDNSSGNDGGGVKTRESRIEFENVVIGGNTASKSGGGVRKVSPGPGSRFENVLVIGNTAGEKGGGMASDSSDMEIANSFFASNEGKEGGNVYKKSGNGRYKNVRIQGGRAIRGGGIYMENCSTEMVNTQFTGNVALNESNFNGGGPPSGGSSFLEGQGGGMFNVDSRPQLINLTISGNFADDSGGGMMNMENSNADIRNTIVHNNQTGVITDSLESGIMNENSVPTFNNSIVQGSNGSDGWNPNAGQDNGNNFDFNPQFSNPLNPSPDPSLGGNFRLGGNSSAIDSGNTDDVPPDVETDIVGNNRRSEAGVDIGAYERQPCLFDVTNTIYVNSNRTDSIGDGTSWATAFNLLFDALFYAADCDSTFFIYIAEGTYYPTDDPTDRHTSVILRNNLNILGGFPGTGNPTLDDRDWRTHKTIISGDINSTRNLNGNSFSIVAAYDADSTALLSGVIIKDGNANGNNGFLLSPVRSGAGIYIANSSPTLEDIRLESNQADFGAGIALVGESAPKMDRMEYVNNTAQLMGGGLADYTTGTDSVLWSNMLFHGNTANMGGGGIFLENTRKSTLANFTLTENTSEMSAGGILNNNSNTHLINSILWNNSSEIGNTEDALSVSFSIVGQDEGLYPGFGNLNVNPNFEDPANNDFSLKDCSPAINAGNGTGLPDFDLLGNERPVNENYDLGAYEFQNAPGSICCPDGNVVFVNQNATGFNNGSNWFNAFNDLQDALNLDCPNVTEIWVATGTYYPDRGTQNRDSSFVLRNGIRLVGGFNGTEAEISERDWETNLTILSGDINQSDSIDGNSYSVISAIGAELTSGLDGFVVTLGNADGTGPDSSSTRSGGGMYVFQASIEVANCSFVQNNAAYSGGGIFLYQSESELSNSVFSENTTSGYGGGIGNKAQSNPLISDCTFNGNHAMNGGAISNHSHSSPAILDCIFTGNEAESGGAISNFHHSAPSVQGCEFNGNEATNGGAISNDQYSSPTIWQSIFSGNKAENGGAISNANHSSPIITQCTFIENEAENGGAISNSDESSPGISRSEFRANIALSHGGAIDNLNNSSPQINNTLFSGNAAEYGGAMANRLGSSPEINSVTISGNLASERGGGLYNAVSGDAIVRNSIIWNNLAQNGFDLEESSVANTVHSNPEFYFSLIQYSGGSGINWESGLGVDGGNNLDVNPDFVSDLDPELAPNIGGNFLLTSCSPIINAGDTAIVAAEDLVDLVGSPRVNNGNVDMGALEYFGPDCGLECPEGNVVYVLEGGAGAENGHSWDDAIGSLQDALEIACGCLNIDQIWVAAGTYYPDDGRLLNSGDRDASFQLCNDVSLLGGFLPGNNSLEERDWAANETILSGNINNPNNSNDNSYSVVTGSGTNSTAIIDGFTITDGSGGLAGGGMYNENGSPFVINLLFVNNQADNGGGMYNDMGSSPHIENCRFENNTAISGGGIYNHANSSPTILNSKIRGNSADLSGGGINNKNSSPEIINTVISGNFADQEGGGISNHLNSSPLVLNSSLSGNEAGAATGGAIFIGTGSLPNIANSIIWNNRAGGQTTTVEATVNSVPEGSNIFTNSLVANSGGSEDWNPHFGADGGNNIDADPLFQENVNLMTIPNTSGDLSIQECSPGVDFGSNELYSSTVDLDLAGNSRIVNSTGTAVDIIDLGAFEFQFQAVLPEISCNNLEVFLDESGEAEVAFEDLYNKLDSCGNLTLLSESVESYSFSCSDVGSFPFFIQFKDETSLKIAQCSGAITIIDPFTPEFSCDASPVVLVVDESCEVIAPDFSGKIDFSDNCIQFSDLSIGQSVPSGSVLPAGFSTQVQIFASEAGGWFESCSFELMVTDTTAPEIQCTDSTIVLVVGESCSEMIGDWTFLASAIDNCLQGGNFTVSQSLSSDFEIAGGEEILLTLLVEESGGWTDSCQYEISAVNLSEYIWISELPESIDLECGIQFEVQNLVAGDFCDTLSIEPQVDSLIGCLGLVQLSISWSFGDLTHDQIVSFPDVSTPEWISPLPPDITVDCSEVPLPETLEALDDCSEVEVTFSEELVPGLSPFEYSLNRNWTASNTCDSIISHSQFILVTDNISPTLSCPTSHTLDAEGMCSMSIPDLSSIISTTDNCTSPEDLQITQIPSVGLTVIVEEVTIFMVVSDEAGNSSNCNFTLFLENYGEEVSLSCQDSLIVNAAPGSCEAFVELSASFTEDCDGVEVVNDFSSNGANADGIYPLGTTLVEFQLFNNGDPALSCVSAVSVMDVQVPVISCPQDLTLQVDTGSCTVFDPDLGQAEAALACAGVEISSDAPVELAVATYIVTYTAIGENGQSSICQQLITVEDNQAPLIICPENLEIILDEEECELSGFEVENAIATSVCGTVEVSNNAPEVFPIGITTIVQVASDINGQQSSCSHLVAVVPMEAPTIECPEDIEIILEEGDCSAENLSLGEASVSGTCEEFVVTDDAPVVFDIGQTIITYTGISNGGTEVNCIQEVSVVSTEGPQIECPDNLVVSSDSGSCIASGIDPGSPQVSHSCFGVIWSSDLPAEFPVGITVVEYTAISENSMTASCTTIIEVVDNEPPAIECPGDLTIEIPNGESEADLSLDPATASDNCGIAFIDNDYNGGENASGIYPLGLTTIVFTVQDVNGNEGTCQTQILVFEEGAPPVTVEISGNFASWAGVNISNVEIAVSGNDPGTYFSNSAGDYIFEVIQGSNVVVTPEKDTHWVDGVTVTDLVSIQRHILGIELLSSPYQIIAADVSGSGSVTTFDLVILQGLIIGLTENIATNKSWLFVPASYEFEDPLNPLSENWPQVIGYQGVNSDLIGQDWVSIKVGDVSGDAGLSGLRVLNEGIDFDLQAEKSGENSYELIVSTSGNERLAGFQLEFEYEDYRAFFDRVDYSRNPAFNSANMVTYVDRELNLVRLVWFNGEDVVFNSGDELFRFVFSEVQKGTDPNRLVKPSFRGTRFQPYLASLDKPDRYFKALWTEGYEGRPFVLHQNRPNPFSRVTEISFEMPLEQDVRIEIYSATGNILYQNTIQGRAGYNSYRLQLEDGVSGLLYLRVTAGRDSAVKKMIRF